MPGIIGVMASTWYGLPDPPTADPLPMVLLRHDHPLEGPHLDWFVARSTDAGMLAAWRLPAWPREGEAVDGVLAGADHDRRWLTRQGVVSGSRGTATRVDEGHLRSWWRVGDTARMDVVWRHGGDQLLSLSSGSEGWSLARALR